MASKTVIANMAISHLGESKTIADLDTETTPQAIQCKLFYETALKQCLRDFQYPFSTRFQALNLITENPTSEWLFSYRVPTDSVHARRIVSGIVPETRQDRVPYRIVDDDEGQAILTNKEDAELEYTKYIDNPDKFPVDFLMVLSLRLAAYIAPTITKGDPNKMGARAMDLYMREVMQAKATASNEEQPPESPVSEFESFRN